MGGTAHERAVIKEADAVKEICECNMVMYLCSARRQFSVSRARSKCFQQLDHRILIRRQRCTPHHNRSNHRCRSLTSLDLSLRTNRLPDRQHVLRHQHQPRHRCLTLTTAWNPRLSRGRIGTGAAAVRRRRRPPTLLGLRAHSAETPARWTPVASNRGSCLTSAASRRRATGWSQSRSTTSTPTPAPTLRTSSRIAPSTSTGRRRSFAASTSITQPPLHRTASTSLLFDHRPPAAQHIRLHPPSKARCLTATSDSPSSGVRFASRHAVLYSV